MDIKSGEIWEASGKNVFRGRDCVGIFDTDIGSDEFMAERARIAAAAPEMLEILKRFLAPDVSFFHGDITFGETTDGKSLEEDIHAVIAKATGKDIPGSGLK